MSNHWFKMYPTLLNDYEIHNLSSEDFVCLFKERLNGSDNIFSKHIRGPFDRPEPSVWKIIRERIFKRDDYTCKYCGERAKKLECDHVIPVAKGGRHEDDNLVTACFKCNRSKRDKSLEEWMAA